MKVICLLLINLSFITLFAQTGKLKDPRDNKVYRTVQIGKQIWMAQDLSNKTIEYECSGFTNSKQDTIHCDEFGIQYTWKIAKRACPNGWHLPSKEEFQELLSNVGGDRKYQYKVLGKGDFNALGITEKQKGASFWTSTSNKRGKVSTFDLHRSITAGVHFGEVIRPDLRIASNSVRCVKDSVTQQQPRVNLVLVSNREIRPAPPEKAVVYFVRDSTTDFKANFSYFDSDKLIGKFSPGKYLRYECTPGPHLFWAHSENSDFIDAEVEAGQIYFIQIISYPGKIKARVELYPVPPSMMDGLINFVNGRNGEIFTPAGLAKATNINQINRGLTKYKEEKSSGKTFPKLQRGMFYVLK